jgi:hypothetical protein
MQFVIFPPMLLNVVCVMFCIYRLILKPVWEAHTFCQGIDDVDEFVSHILTGFFTAFIGVAAGAAVEPQWNADNKSRALLLLTLCLACALCATHCVHMTNATRGAKWKTGVMKRGMQNDAQCLN